MDTALNPKRSKNLGAKNNCGTASLDVKFLIPSIIAQLRAGKIELRRKNEIMDTIANTKKAKEKLGWKPRVEIDNGLSNLLN